MTAVLPVGLGTAACSGPKYFLLCSYLPFGFVNVKFAPLTVEADVRLGTDVCIKLPRVVIAPRFARGDGAGLNSASVSEAALCLRRASGGSGAAQDLGSRLL